MTINDQNLEVQDWGLLSYGDALARQKNLVKARLAEGAADRLVLVEHLPVVTIGSSGETKDLRVPSKFLRSKDIDLHPTNRGGRATYHGPGQMVAYPVIKLKNRDLHWYVNTLLETVAAVLKQFGLEPEFKKGTPGIWVKNKKIVSVGIAVRRWVTFHGVALNVNTELTPFDWIIPCGHPEEIVTSMEQELGQSINLSRVKHLFVEEFRKAFGYENNRPSYRPQWLKVPFQQTETFGAVEEVIKRHDLFTVCHSAHCPNRGECFNRGTATFMILGNACTRGCRFCAVDKNRPDPVDISEPVRVAQAVGELELKYAVVTSVTRDDLADGGAAQFARTITAIREKCPEAKIEILVPDFKGSERAVQTVCHAKPDMFNHNIETVPRLYPSVRPLADFNRSLKVLSVAAQLGLGVKSGMMLGLGESLDEIHKTFACLLKAGCEYLTLGQYLVPSEDHIAVARYLPPEEFDSLARIAKSMGFRGVAAGPLVRSSYRAEMLVTGRTKNKTLHQAFPAGINANYTKEDFQCTISLS